MSTTRTAADAFLDRAVAALDPESAAAFAKATTPEERRAAHDLRQRNFERLEASRGVDGMVYEDPRRHEIAHEADAPSRHVDILADFYDFFEFAASHENEIKSIDLKYADGEAVVHFRDESYLCDDGTSILLYGDARSGPEKAQLIVSIALARGLDNVYVRGSAKFKRELARQCWLAGITVNNLNWTMKQDIAAMKAAGKTPAPRPEPGNPPGYKAAHKLATTIKAASEAFDATSLATSAAPSPTPTTAPPDPAHDQAPSIDETGAENEAPDELAAMSLMIAMRHMATLDVPNASLLDRAYAANALQHSLRQHPPLAVALAGPGATPPSIPALIAIEAEAVAALDGDALDSQVHRAAVPAAYVDALRHDIAVRGAAAAAALQAVPDRAVAPEGTGDDGDDEMVLTPDYEPKNDDGHEM